MSQAHLGVGNDIALILSFCEPLKLYLGKMQINEENDKLEMEVRLGCNCTNIRSFTSRS